MNRAQRRAAAKATPRYKRGLTPEQKIAKLYKNGITSDDLKREWRNGYEAGFKEASPETVRSIYAAILLAVHEQPIGWGKVRAKRLLDRVDGIITNALCSTELIQQVWEKMGLRLNFSDPLDPIEEVD